MTFSKSAGLYADLLSLLTAAFGLLILVDCQTFLHHSKLMLGLLLVPMRVSL